MVCGHSYMPCDRAFGWIEKEIKKVPRINRPVDYEEIIRNARTEGVFTIQMQQADFFNVKALKNRVTIRRPKKPLLFSKGRTFILTKNKPWCYSMISDRGSADVDLEKRNLKGPPEKRKNKTAPVNIPSPLMIEQLETPYVGKIVQLDAIKIRHLGELKQFLSADGRLWVEQVTQEQDQAVSYIEEERDEEERNDDIENRTDDNHAVYAEVLQPQ